MYNTAQANNKSFQESLRNMAQQCADGADIHIAWHNFLFAILRNWNTDIQMNLYDAVNIMLSATGLDEFIKYKGFPYYTLLIMRFGIEPKIDFWFKLPAELQMLPQEVQHKKRIFMMTVAVFETINYWCWHDWYHILLNREALIGVLENGSISINWTSYQ